ncbi:MAG TPA: superinfection immunity protein [Pseudolabrys sp.]|nr:superinfection immunity protein [Pseudolabrys sp.]
MNNGPNVAAGVIWLIVILAIVITIYFTPAIVAYRRKHAQFTAILWLDILTGWTFLGWVAALIWALSNPQVVSTKPVGDSTRYTKAEYEKTCPECAETVKGAAKVCRFCGHKFEETLSSPHRPSSPAAATRSFDWK